jgi:rubrerythrin
MAKRSTATSTAEDPRVIEFAHAALDELGVPRASDRGRLTLFGRIEALRAGRFDQARLSPPRPAPKPLRPCPRCGLQVMAELGEVCPSCSTQLEAPAPATAG